MNKKVLIIVAVLVVCFLCLCGIVGGGVFIYNQNTQQREYVEFEPGEEIDPPDLEDLDTESELTPDDGGSAGDDQSSDNGSNSSSSTDGATQNTQEAIETMEEIFSNNDNLKCDWSATVEGQSSSGVMYKTKDKIRMDIVAEGEKVYMIFKDKMSYMWFDSVNTGIKSPFEDISEITKEYSGELPDVNDGDYSFKCDPWTVDNSVFTPPADITFMDASEWEY